MAGSSDPSEILLKLVIRGMDPAEVSEMSSMTREQLVNEQKVTIERLQALHRGSLDAQNADMAKAIDLEIKAQQDKLSSYKTIIDSQVREQARVSAAAEQAAQDQADAADKAAAAIEKAKIKEQNAANRAADQWESANNRAIAAEERAAAAAEKAAAREAAAHAKAAEKTAENLANIMIVAQGAVAIWQRLASSAAAFAEQVVRVSQVMNSPGGQNAMALSGVVGDVSGFDIAVTKNKALQAEINLTDKDMVMLAHASSALAHQMGTDTKEAMDAFIMAMETGRTRGLLAIGVQVDAVAVYKEFAAANNTVVESLTEEQKHLAMHDEIMKQIAKRAPEVGESVTTLGKQMENAAVSAKNIWDALLTTIGNAKMPSWLSSLTDSSMSEAEMEDLSSTGAGPEIKKQLAARQLARQIRSEQLRSSMGVGTDDLAAGTDEDNLDPISGSDDFLNNRFSAKPEIAGMKDETAKKAKAAAKTAAAEAQRREEFNNKLFKPADLDPETEPFQNEGDPFETAGIKQGEDYDKSAEDYVAAIEKQNAADEQRAVVMAHVNSLSIDRKGITVDTAVAYQKLADSMGLEVAQLDHDERMEAISNETKVKTAELIKAAKKEADARRAELKTTKDKAGFMSIFLWGPDGPDQTYKEMDKFQQQMVDTMGEVSKSVEGGAEKLSTAVGTSIGAALAGAAAGSKSIKQQTHDILLAMAEQAAGKAVWEGAEALADAAIGNFPGAGLHAAAAAAFAGVAITAGLGARATASSGAAAPTASASTSKTTSGLSSSSSNSFGTGSKTSANDNSQAPPITINMTVLPGGEAQAGRSVKSSLDALYAQTGQATLATHT